MSAIEKLRKELGEKEEWGAVERCIIEMWESYGFERLADNAAEELFALRARVRELEAALEEARVAADAWLEKWSHLCQK